MPGHRLDPPVGRTENGAWIAVDRPRAIAQLSREEGVEARPASGVTPLDALVERDVVDPGIEPYNGAAHGRGPRGVREPSDCLADALSRQDAQNLGGGVGDGTHG